MDKNKLLKDVIEIHKQNKLCSEKIIKKKFLKKKYEPIDFVDIFLKQKDRQKEINHKYFKNFFLKMIDRNWINWVESWMNANVYSNRYRRNFSKIFQYKATTIDEKYYHSKLQILLVKCHNDLKKAYLNNSPSKVKDYLQSRNFPFEYIEYLKFGTNEFLSENDCGILSKNIFLNVKHTIPDFRYYGVTFMGLNTGGVRIIDPAISQIFKYFFFAVRDDLYGVIGKSKSLVIAEGVFDLVGMLPLGYDTGFCFGSCSPSYIQLQKLKRIIKQENVHEIILSVDNDVGGVCLAQDIISYFKKMKFKLITFNEVSEDPYECFIENRTLKYEIKDFNQDDLDFRSKLVLDHRRKYKYKL